MSTINRSSSEFFSYEELKNSICLAFSDTKHPEDKCIVNGAFPPLMPDSIEIYNLYRGRSWETLNNDFFYLNGAIQFSIGFLTKESFLYYLPAFMIHLIDPNWNKTTGCLIESLLYELDPDGNRNNLPILKKLDAKQSKCVASFLKFLSLHEEIYGYETAIETIILLDKYWNKFFNIDEVDVKPPLKKHKTNKAKQMNGLAQAR